MIFVCALIPISCVAVALSFGGGSAAAMLITSLLYLLAFGFVKRFGRARILAVPLFVFSASLRLCSLYARCSEALGVSSAAALVAFCLIVSAFAAYNGVSVVRSAAPILFLTAILCVYIAAVSFSDAEFKKLPSPPTVERIAALVCPLSICSALSRISSYPPIKRFSGGLIGTSVCAVLLLFPKAQAEFGLLCVPLVCFACGLEFKSAVSVIMNPKSA